MAKNDLDEEAAEGDELEGGAADANKKKKLIIIIVAAAIVLLGGVAATLYFLHLPPFGGGSSEEAGATDEKKEEAHTGVQKQQLDKDGKPVSGPIYYDMQEFLVDLNTGGKQTSFLKMRVTLELAGSDAIPVIEANLPKIVDSFNTYLRELRVSDLAGSAGIYRLREELLTRINKIIAPAQVKTILFSDILVQ